MQGVFKTMLTASRQHIPEVETDSSQTGDDEPYPKQFQLGWKRGKCGYQTGYSSGCTSGGASASASGYYKPHTDPAAPKAIPFNTDHLHGAAGHTIEDWMEFFEDTLGGPLSSTPRCIGETAGRAVMQKKRLLRHHNQRRSGQMKQMSQRKHQS